MAIPLAVVGCDFRVASATWRGLVVLPDEERQSFSGKLLADGTVDGFVSLDTCNRTEWIVSSNEPTWAAQVLEAQMIERWMRTRPDESHLPRPYVHVGEAAVRHVLRVVAGLESFARGEAEIAGQFHRALGVARSEGTTSPILNGLGKVAGRASREAYHAGFQSSGRRGVHGLALALLDSRLPADASQVVAVVGQGEIGRKAAALLDEYTPWQVTRLNRTVPSDNPADIRGLDRLAEACADAAAVVLCSGAPLPVLRPEHLADRKSHGPLLVVDLGVPPQADGLLEEDPRVKLFGLDELPRPAEDADAAAAAERAIEDGVQLFQHFCAERSVAAVLHATQSRHVVFTQETVPRFLEENLPDLPEAERRKLAVGLRGLIRQYTNEIFRSIHETVDSSSGRP